MPTVTFIGGPMDGQLLEVPEIYPRHKAVEAPRRRISFDPQAFDLSKAIPLTEVIYHSVRRDTDGAWFYIEQDLLKMAEASGVDVLASA